MLQSFVVSGESPSTLYYKARAKLIGEGSLKPPNQNGGLYICVPPGQAAEKVDNKVSSIR